MHLKMFDVIRDNKLKIIYYENKLNIINYKRILIFDKNKVSIDTLNKVIVVRGEDLLITKFVNDELLITGKIKEIKMEDL